MICLRRRTIKVTLKLRFLNSALSVLCPARDRFVGDTVAAVAVVVVAAAAVVVLNGSTCEGESSSRARPNLSTSIINTLATSVQLREPTARDIEQQLLL